MLARMQEGFDVVYGVRKGRKRGFAHRLIYRTSYRVLKSIVDIDLPNDAGDFAVMSRRVVNVLNDMPERHRYLRGLRAWSGFEQTGIEYDREARFAGRPGYTARKWIVFAKDAVFSFSYKPLGFISVAGLAIALVGALSGVLLILKKLTGYATPSWGPMVTVVLFFCGVQMLSLGIIGEYISRIYDEVKRRPTFLVRDAVGFEDEGASDHDQSS